MSKVAAAKSKPTRRPAAEPAADADSSNGSETRPGKSAPNARLLVRDLGWSEDEAADTYHRCRAFAADWDAPGMDAYDAL